MALVLGLKLEVLNMLIKRQSLQTLGLDWFNDTSLLVPSDLTGVTMTVILGNRDAPVRSWAATNVANRTLWALDETDTDLPFDQYSGHLVMTTVSGEALLFSVTADVEE